LIPHVSGVARPGSPSPALPVAVTVLVVLAIWIAYLPLLPVGGFRFFDEFHTLDRTSAFASHGDWFTVYSMNEPSFRKPPLQYWMSALLLHAGVDQMAAMRLPSMIFALGGMVSVALLAAAVMPWNLWAMPAAVLLFASSTQYWQHALSAMLDSGAVFFANLALAAAILALRRPGWWYVAGAAIALGSLQKASIGLVVVALYLAILAATARWHGFRWRDLAARRPFRIALWIAIVGSIAWPVGQALLHGAEALAEFFGDQMIDRFLPGDPRGDLRGLGDLGTLILGGEPWLRWPAIAALAWLPWRMGRMELLPLPLVFALFVAAMLMAGGHVTARYTLIFLPMLAVALAAVTLSLVPRVWLAAPVVALLVWAGGGPVKSAADLELAGNPNYAEQIDALSHAGAQLRPDETLVVCLLEAERRIIPALASHYAANGRPFVRLMNTRSFGHATAAGAFDGPLLGVCMPEDLRVFADGFADLRIIGARNGYVIWRASHGR
jgi:4-amino-4-deoxy-L-arabinose transferase-like glycosyltransferase